MADIAANPGPYATSAPLAAGAESRFSGVSWGAIVAGAVVAAAMAIILTTLGAGLGLIAVSPWPGEGASAGAVGAGVIIWSIVIEIVAFGIGGYLAGRLRTKWANLHGDEVYFRDTAHGFVTWALGTLVGIFVMTALLGSVVRTGAEVGAAGVGAAGAGAVALASNADTGGAMPGNAMQGSQAGSDPMNYYIDMLFRPAGSSMGANGASNANSNGGGTTASGTTTSDTGATTGATTGMTTTTGGASAPTMAMNGSTTQPGGDAAMRSEVGRIAAASFKNGDLTLAPADRTYIAQLVAQRTGLSQQDAEKRVDDVFGQAKAAYADFVTKTKQAADQARKAGIGLALWTFVAMLVGAFVASWMAAVGGRLRDQ